MKRSKPYPTTLTAVERRQRRADQIANALYTAAMYGYPARLEELIEMGGADLNDAAPLRLLLHQAPQAAANFDPSAVRTARSGRGTLLVLRIHGPDWSLVMTGGRPRPAYLIALHDTYWPGIVWNLHDPLWEPELRTMCRRIDEALTRRPSAERGAHSPTHHPPHP